MKRALLYLVITWCAVGLAHADQAIRSLQQALKQQGFYYGKVTGEQSAETTTAVRRYQIRNGLKVTGEMNEETTRSLNASSNSLATVSQTNSKAAPQVNQTSRTPSLSPSDREPNANPSYSTSFYQSAPVRMNRRTIAAAQYQLMSRGFYRGRIDGNYGSQTALAVRAFQSSAGLAPSGRLDMQTLDALQSLDANLSYVAPASPPDETWMPVRKFKHHRWIMKWKKYLVGSGGGNSDGDRQANDEYQSQGY
jgi:peptidoglycan hydrolase-like protein with peptidoglycan-binding domain